jgi:hypothetical protein
MILIFTVLVGSFFTGLFSNNHNIFGFLNYVIGGIVGVCFWELIIKSK